MLIKVTAKGFRFEKKLHNHLKWHAEKIVKRMPHLKIDLPQLDLLIRRTVHEFYTDKGGILENYNGSLSLNLPHDGVHVYFEGRSPDECIDKGIELLKKELKRYKERHFKSDSHYPSRSSVRSLRV